MKAKIVLVSLIAGNLLCAVALWTVLTFQTGQAEGSLQVSNLTYGEIDADGDGECTLGDDRLVELALESSPHVIEEALKTAKVNDDGTVDISSHLWKISENNKERHLRSLKR